MLDGHNEHSLKLPFNEENMIWICEQSYISVSQKICLTIARPQPQHGVHVPRIIHGTLQSCMACTIAVTSANDFTGEQRQLPCLCSLCQQSEPCRPCHAATNEITGTKIGCYNSASWGVEAKHFTQQQFCTLFSSVKICHRPQNQPQPPHQVHCSHVIVDIRWLCWLMLYVPIQPSAEHWE